MQDKDEATTFKKRMMTFCEEAVTFKNQMIKLFTSKPNRLFGQPTEPSEQDFIEYFNSLQNKDMPCDFNSNDDKHYLLEIYKSYLQFVTALTIRRWHQHSVTLVFGAVLFTAVAIAYKEKFYPFSFILSIITLIYGFSWLCQAKNNNITIRMNYSILKCMEQSGMPLRLFTFERELMDRNGFVSNTKLEQITIWIFISIFIVAAFASVGRIFCPL